TSFPCYCPHGSSKLSNSFTWATSVLQALTNLMVGCALCKHASDAYTNVFDAFVQSISTFDRSCTLLLLGFANSGLACALETVIRGGATKRLNREELAVFYAWIVQCVLGSLSWPARRVWLSRKVLAVTI